MALRISALTETDVDDFAFGCALLGTGGGGSVGGARLEVAHAIREFGPVPVVHLDDLPPDGLVMPLSSVGAPTVSFEMLNSGGEAAAVLSAVEKEFGRTVVAVMASEIGGSNGVGTAMWAARLGLPLLDADAMGRAFPEVQMVSFYVAGAPVAPLCMADFQGNVATFRPIDGAWSESLARAFSVACGGVALMSDYTMTAGEMAGRIVAGSVSRAHALGRAARASSDPVAAIRKELGAFRLISGKVTELERRTGGGFVRGSFVISGTGDDKARNVRIDIQNENLMASEGGRALATVPDLISVIDSQTGVAIATEELLHGMRVTALAWPSDPLWRTERGVQTVGPRAFGYDLDYVPIEELHRA
ncbi:MULTISPECIES: DUF917 domain-containing protein [unclassified Microbacterium]|uniref:DUF917 domain-containing protein n=1 Tax=unclassified Microbacterium TaxID=2609290 RepID=UPI0034657884